MMLLLEKYISIGRETTSTTDLFTIIIILLLHYYYYINYCAAINADYNAQVCYINIVAIYLSK